LLRSHFKEGATHRALAAKMQLQGFARHENNATTTNPNFSGWIEAFFCSNYFSKILGG
jgi:hypothetical protein